MKLYFLLCLIFINLFDTYGQNGTKRCGIDFPTTVCESQELNGDVTLTWKKPDDQQGVFLQYELFSKESPFTPISTINNINTTSVTIPNNYLANNFFITTSTLCNGVLEKYTSDTTQITKLNSVKIDEGIEQLSWADEIKNQKDSIYIERKTTISAWKKIDSLTFDKKIYFDTVDICNKNKLFYRIGIKKSGCISYSTIISDTLKDSYHPNIPQIVALGYDTSNQNLVLSWKKTKENDIKGFIIYQENNGLSSTLDTVLSNGAKIDTFYTIFNPTTTNISTYRVAAFDYCYSIAPKYQTSAQSKAFFSTILKYDYNVCSKETNLNWNKIITDDEVKIYRIFLQKNNIWYKIDSTTNQHFLIKLEKFTSNKITIETITQNGYSFFSNICPIYSKSPTEPKISYTNYASVKDEYIEIKHTLTPTLGLKEIALFKLNNQNIFEEIEKKDANNSEIFFIDKNVNTSKNSYQYYIQHIDSCGNYTQKNMIQKTILLEENFQNEDSLSTSILFNNYVGFSGGNNKYIIELSTDGLNYSTTKEIYSDSTLFFEYKIVNKEQFEGKICFKVSCLENNNIYNVQSKSYSNPICFYFEPRIFIPTAFTPNGDNPIFKPIISISKIYTYELTIFNRWGQPVFNSTNAEEGWNGIYGNNDAPNGLYVYQLKVNAGSDKEIIKRGLINLIR